MKRLSIVAATFALILSLAATSQAGILVNLTQFDPPFSAPDQNLTGFTAWQVNVESVDGANISAVDVLFTGKMNQRWSDTDFDGVANPTPVGPPGNGRGDSHLTPIAGALVASAPTEDNTFEGSLGIVGAFEYGLGTFMSGAWGIPGASQSNTANIAYVVVPDGELVVFNYAIATATGTFEGSSNIIIPEPSTMLMAGMGLVGLAFRRRRNG
jgi:hypothetical protein